MVDASSNPWVSQMDIEHQLRIESLRTNQDPDINDLVKERWQVTVDMLGSGKSHQALDNNFSKLAKESTLSLSEIDSQPVTFEKIRPMQGHFDRLIGIDTRQIGKKSFSEIKK